MYTVSRMPEVKLVVFALIKRATNWAKILSLDSILPRGRCLVYKFQYAFKLKSRSQTSIENVKFTTMSRGNQFTLSFLKIILSAIEHELKILQI